MVIGTNGGGFIAANNILINASGNTIGVSVTGGTYINPVRTIAGSASSAVLTWNTGTSEIYLNSAKTFVIDHPVDKSKYLVHACLEGPEAGVYYRGKDTIEHNSKEITLPSYVDKFSDDFTVLVTPVYKNKIAHLAASEVIDGKFTVHSDIPCSFNWLVTGKRGNVEVEVDKSKATINGSGPYTWVGK